MLLISVRAFASYREAIGAPSLKLNVPEGTTAGQIWETLLIQYPRLLGLPRPHVFTINHEYGGAPNRAASWTEKAKGGAVAHA